ncbi:Ldh family oxidoreductase [Roseibium aestuarii]|uniref:Ldh family oxidoreductase n=1 Tax=Roseibium aestuarii TaxID=2600299 RepID=A0ABW4JR78_9HYPH|nr:Ldh family oxidoreductase [Roseibium aestuarii]
MTDVTLTLQEAHELVFQALVANRTSAENARQVADALVAAEAAGQPGHGLSRVPVYAVQSRSGKVDGYVMPEMEKAAPGLLRIDARNGFAYPAISLALEALPEMARTQGIAMAAIRRSHHFGLGGAHCEVLADKGLVSFVFGNAPAAIAPWGGKTALFGTNPIAFAAPVPGQPALVIDMAMSNVAKGKIMRAEMLGQPIPEGWALDEDGNPTTDASKAMKGTMVPIGGAKGAALALMVDVLGGALLGAALGHQAPSLFKADGPPMDLGQVIIAIDPQLSSFGAFGDKMLALVDAIDGVEGARLPGSRRIGLREAARRDGLKLPQPIHDEIRALAGRVGRAA